MSTKKKFKATLEENGGMIRVPFDPAAVFGKARAPVKITLNGHTYRTTIASMGDGPCVPLRKSNRDAAKLAVDATVEVTIELDEEERTVETPEDLSRALAKVKGGKEAWEKLSYTHRREHVEAIEGAKKEDTRARRIAAAVKMVGEGREERRQEDEGRSALNRRCVLYLTEGRWCR
jgi:hypothetical protein